MTVSKISLKTAGLTLRGCLFVLPVEKRDESADGKCQIK
jgi:hypothetical protein